LPKVSVIVPVYNPGRHIDDCLRTLLGQSLPADDLELIFVDDGSTDGTPARLDALAAAHPHVRVEHIPNSGWPGRPRNVGFDLATGDYVFYVDNDDWLDREALERLHAMAVLDRADVVVGKVVGHGKTVPRALFRSNQHGVRFESVTLLGLLSPHKLFRRAFLLEHGIRFPEGRRRLEDHVFVVHAYLHAERISVLADHPCYHWALRDREASASFGRFDPEGYFDNVREVLDLVEEHLEPGPFRDRVLSHWYRGKMLGRVGGGAFRRRDEAFNRSLIEVIRRLAQERFDWPVEEKLAFNLRARSALLRAGDHDGLMELAALEGPLRARVKGKRTRGDGTHLSLELTATLGARLQFVRDGDRVRWLPPEGLRERLAGVDLDVTDELGDAKVQVYLHSASDESEYLLPSSTTVTLEGKGSAVRTLLHARAQIAPSTAAAGAPLPAGNWEVRAQVTVAGFTDTRPAKRAGAPLVVTSIPPTRVIERRDAIFRQPLGRRVSARVPRLARLVRRARARAGAASPD
jgi:glycosyltransferase involved in cell wall biosynthesis